MEDSDIRKTLSGNKFIARALPGELAAQKRAEIDADFAKMADDDEYQTESIAIARENFYIIFS